MKRFLIILLLTCLVLSACAGDKNESFVSEPFSENPMTDVDDAYLLAATDIESLLKEYESLTLRIDGEDHEITCTDLGLTIDINGETKSGAEATDYINTVLPRVFENDTELQLETNLLDDGTGEAVIYMFIDETVKNAFPDESLVTDEVFSVYYELDKEGRVISVTYSKAVDRENFKILRMVTITY